MSNPSSLDQAVVDETKRPVTVLGTGMMGAAVVRALLAAGHPVTAWNRTRARAEPLAELGAVVVDDVVSAVESSDVTISMLLDHDIVVDTLSGPIAAGSLRDRVFVSLTTCTPQEVPGLATLVESAGGRFLDGTIPAYPDGIGRRGVGLICSGSREVWDDVADIIKALGGRSHLASEELVAAAVIDTAAIGAFAITAQVACMEAFAYARTFGVGTDELLPYLLAVTGDLTRLVEDLADRIRREEWTTERATLQTLRFSMELFAGSGAQAGMPHGPTAGALASLTHACTEGHEDLDLVALHEVLRRDTDRR